MKTSVLGTFAATALFALAISSCSSPSAAPADSSQAPASLTAATTGPAATPTPTATPKAYTSDELAVIVRQLRDSADRRLTAVPGEELAATLEQSKEMLNAVEVEPAECKELAASSSLPSLDGAAMAMGMSADTSTGAVTAVSLMAGVDQAVLDKVADPCAQLEKCSQMSMRVSGADVLVTITPLDGVSGVAGAAAYRTDTQLPDGQVQSVVTAQVVHQGVLVTAVSSGGDGESGVARTGALLDSAAAVIN